jgi:hypothetical protein
MTLFDELNKLNEENSNSGQSENSVDYPSSHLHHYPLQVGKKTPQLHVRILPALKDKHTWVPFRELWVKEGDKRRSYCLDANTRSEVDPLMQAVNRWDSVKFTRQNGDKAEEVSGLYKLDSKYGSYPSLRYYINVVPLEVVKDSNGVSKYKEKLTADGKLDVYMLSLNRTLLNLLATQLQDEMLNPNNIHLDIVNKLKAKGYSFTDDELANSFISDVFAYPVTLRYSSDGKTVTRTLTVDSSDAHMLSPLPRNWEEQAEDLEYQATPSYKYNEHWVNVLIDRIDSELGLTSHIEAPKQPVTRQQDPFPDKAVQVNSVNNKQSETQSNDTGSVVKNTFPDIDSLLTDDNTNEPTNNSSSDSDELEDILSEAGLNDETNDLFN